jgi:hypothetical protein
MGVATDPSFRVVRRERREPELCRSGQTIEKCDESQVSTIKIVDSSDE